MGRKKMLFVAQWVLLGLLTVHGIDCTCNQPADSCSLSTDCHGNLWMNSQCTEEEGYWTCENHACRAKCGPVVCEDATDCMVLAWPTEEAGCPPLEGVWTCEDTKCVPRCNKDECERAEDCNDGRDWPQDAGCAESLGHWECTDGYCAPVCNYPSCTSPADCAVSDWPADVGCEETDGHWECTDGSCAPLCDQTTCSTPADCETYTWPPEVDCARAHGRWECTDGSCVARCNEECDDPSGCDWKSWIVDCVGHWDCVLGLCQEVCESETCTDGTCDETGGETARSCPQDCGVSCQWPADCAEALWDFPCEGRWACQDSACQEVCDYNLCGNGQCNQAEGETAETCPSDCMVQCHLPSDCLEQHWTQICQGLWACDMGTCREVCESIQCHNGVCSPELGENSESCYADCGAGPCADVTDCLGLDWTVDCEGRWQCDQTRGACQEDCETPGCGDGLCDILGGEDAGSCPDDCGDYACHLTSQCENLTLPDGCTSWLCIQRACVPLCP